MKKSGLAKREIVPQEFFHRRLQFSRAYYHEKFRAPTGETFVLYHEKYPERTLVLDIELNDVGLMMMRIWGAARFGE